MSRAEPILLDQSGAALSPGAPDTLRPAQDWPPISIRRDTIEREIERLADLPRPANGRRQVQFVHPSANPETPGLNPGVRVTMEVLLPGEETTPVRHNSTQVNFCIRGEGLTVVGGKQIRFQQYDVWNHPSYVPYRHVNDSRDLHVRFTYSNAPLLEMLRVHLVEEDPPLSGDVTAVEVPRKESANRGTSPYGTFPIDEDGALLMPYEILISPPAVESKALHWPWTVVKANLDKLAALGKDYIGRRLYLMYNPMTGRSNGTTPGFFATITIRPPNIIDRPHRHVSSAINYYFHGRGYSVVEGERYEWEAGDLMVSAPGWAVHNHASYDGEPVYELTVQDQPMHIMMESLLWQESLKEPAAILGSDVGFATNRRTG